MMNAKKFELLAMCLFCFSQLQAQDDNTWYAFTDEQTQLSGFKNGNGDIVLKPIFQPHFVPARLDDIMAVMDTSGNTYYQAKSGRKIAQDSVYIFDATFDCESEGYIRFQNPANEKVGLLNKNGTVVIPPVYDALSQVNNGMVVGLLNASKILLHPEDNGCEHYTWHGGKTVLVDTMNGLLIDDFDNHQYLNLYSLRISKKPIAKPYWVNQAGEDGRIYNFIDFEKEFRYWLDNEFLEHLKGKKLQKLSYDSITYWSQKSGWTNSYKVAFWQKHQELVITLLSQLDTSQIEIFKEGLNPYIFSGKEFQKYFDNCNQPLENKYPVYDLVISHKINEELIQDHFSFLHTTEGYRLISVAIRSED